MTIAQAAFTYRPFPGERLSAFDNHPFVRLVTLMAWAWLTLFGATGAALASEVSSGQLDGPEVAACAAESPSAHAAEAPHESSALEVGVGERVEGGGAEGAPPAQLGRTWPAVASPRVNTAKDLAATSMRVRAVSRERGAPEARAPPRG